MIRSKNHFHKLACLSSIFLTGMFFSFSCTDLSEESFTELRADDFFQTEEDIEKALVPVYSQLRQVCCGWHGNFDLQEETSDILITPTRGGSWFDGGTYIRLQLHNWAANQSQPGNLWNRSYTGINNANRLLFQIDNAEFDIPNEEALVAEVKAARAFYYLLLLDNFRNVPLITSFDVPEGFLPDQVSPEELFDFIESELTSHLDLLSSDNDQSTYGRFNKWAALSTLAKLYLNAEVYIGSPRWTGVIEVTDEIINSGLFSLESNYRVPFSTNNDQSAELIFAVPFETDVAEEFHIHMKSLHQANQRTYQLRSNPWNGMGVQPHFVDSYHSEDQRLDDTWLSGVQLAANGDTLEMSQNDSLIGKPLVYENELLSIHDTAENDLFRIGKYEIAPNSSSSLSTDFPIYRYADVLMMKAEAILRIGGDPAEAAALVNEVRARAFEPDEPVSPNELIAAQNLYGAEVNFGRMLMELGWEFAAEGRRRSDLVRFGIYTRGTWGVDHVPNGEYRDIFPIPEDAINRNPSLVQNPGY